MKWRGDMVYNDGNRETELRGRGEITPLSSLPPLPCPPEGAQVGFELLTATEAIGSLKLKRLIGGAAALSPNRSIALAISGGSVGSIGSVDRVARSHERKTQLSQPCRQIDGRIPRRAKSERRASKSRADRVRGFGASSVTARH